MRNLYRFLLLFFITFLGFSQCVFCQIDTIPPLVSAIGPIPTVVPCDGEYIEFGANAYDETDGILDVEIGGDCVCPVQAGAYIVTYTAIDFGGNETTIEKLVIVQGDCNTSCCGPINNSCIIVCDGGPPEGAFDAKDDFVQTPVNSPIEIPVLDNEHTYYSNNDLKIRELLTLPHYGTASIIDDELIRYEPGLDFIGVDSLQYRAMNFGERTSEAFVYIEIGTTNISFLSSPQLQLYPNPTQETLTIQIEGNIVSQKNLQLLMFDTLGKLQKVHSLPSNAIRSTVDVSQLKRGLYVYQLQGEGKIITSGKLLLE